MRNITALLIALLVAASCSSAPSASSALSGQLPPPTTTTTTPTNPQLTYADMSPKCAEALDAASLLNPVPAIYSEVPPEYGPGSVDWLADTDGDGLIKSDERLLGTNPQNPDTDGDGISDGEECTELDSDPLDPNDPDPGSEDDYLPPPTTTPPPTLPLACPATDNPVGTCPTPLPTVGEVILAIIPSCSSVTIHWAPATTSGLQSFTLASKAPDGGWIAHSTFLASDRAATLPNLVSGLHNFQLLARYTGGEAVLSDVGEVVLSDCPPPGSEDD